MLLKTKVPNRVVQRRVRKPGGGFRIKPWFRFDSEGYAEIDETKLTQSDINKLMSTFEVVEKQIVLKKEVKKEVEKEIKDMSYQELQTAYALKTGNSAVGKKKKDLIEELEV